ncbi:MAG: multiheme c-type cytochrome [Gemmatimonadaceae bacterium]|jgi:hypothetical protein
MTVLLRKSMVALTGVVILVSVAARQPVAQSPAPAAPAPAPVVDNADYVGADACKVCHEKHYEAWAATKHSRALSKLQASDREGGKCIKCHVTGSEAMITAQGATPSFPNVQCEGCHGAGAAHIEAAKTGDTVTARPKPTTETSCTRCHNETSPHYKPFFYSAMKGLSHSVK